MQIWVLGTVEVSHADRAVELRGALPRRLLALLTLAPGQELSADRLVEGLWGGAPPAAATTTLQSHVARLRRMLPDPRAVRTGRGGYQLDLDPDAIDRVRFEREVSRGTALLAQARHEEAAQVLGSALGLWRGTPYAEFAGCVELEVEAERLESLRLDALEQRLTADLARPGSPSVVAELEALVRWHPVRESLWALLMTALYRGGRQGDALAAYQRARRVLADELAVDPGPVLRDLERRILEQDPALETTGFPSLLSAPAGRTYAHRVALVERSEQLASLTALAEESTSGEGRLVLVHGEAGVGKSALVRELCGSLDARAQVLWGACDPLSSPRPLGPLVDMAARLGPDVQALLRREDRDGLFDAVLAALEALGPAVVVLEDLHWADASSLDLVRFLARRVAGVPALVVATYRDDQLPASDPLRRMLGDIASQPAVVRMPVPLLSREAVAELVGGTGIDASALHAETGGNPFLVTEIVAAGGVALPATVQDAVLARTQRLSPQARLALQSAAVVGMRSEPSLLHGLPDVTPDSVDECVSAGLLVFDPPVYAFRHELLRQAVLAGVAPGRMGALHWQVLDRLRTMPLDPPPWARLAEHAEMAGDAQATLEFGLAAGDAARRLGSHREAAFQYGRALAHADLLDLEARIDLLDKRATECLLIDRLHDGLEARRRQIDLLRTAGDDVALARGLLKLDRLYGSTGDMASAVLVEDEAISILEALGVVPDLALAYAYRSGRHMVCDEFAEGIAWARRGLELAEATGNEEAVIYCLNTLGACSGALGDPGAEDLLLESLRRAQAIGLDNEAGRAFTNLAYVLEGDHRLDDAVAVLEEGMAFTEERDLHGSFLCMLASRGSLVAEQGSWDEAVTIADELLHVRRTERLSRAEPLLVLALVGSRRGDRDDVVQLIDEALAITIPAQQLQYDAIVAAARAEIHLLEGDADAAIAVLEAVLPRARRSGATDHVATLTLWMHRAGGPVDVEGLGDGPESLVLQGRHREAFDVWCRRGRPYQAAWALLDSDQEVDLREARARFEQLGATVLVARCDDRLRALGARVPRGARASTRANVGGLTDRELEVLALLDEGLRNAEIAGRLHLSEKTVGHHVSAILTKLGASSRLEAVRRARDLASAG